jgi:hypothetical protein
MLNNDGLPLKVEPVLCPCYPLDVPGGPVLMRGGWYSFCALDNGQLGICEYDVDHQDLTWLSQSDIAILP